MPSELSSTVPLAWLAPLCLAIPAITFLYLSGFWLLWRTPSERFTRRTTSTALSLTFVASLAVAWLVFSGPQAAWNLQLGSWFAVPGYPFPLGLHIDRLSAQMMLLITAICGLIGRFSVTYLHREPGFLRFFLLLLLFTSAMLLLVMAGSIDLLFAGWELVGLSSFLLIAFFQERPGAVRGGLRAFITYRACDIGLLLGCVALHHFAGSSEFSVILESGAAPWSAGALLLTGLLFLLGAMGKSAQAPLTGWLPRAMEGPTPSSALFYGALSIHAGAYLLLRLSPLLLQSPGVGAAIVAIGASTALLATLSARVQSDVKSALAYATAAQVGLIFVEIGLGWSSLAALHLSAHACLRVVQLLRAPDALHDLRRAQAARGGRQPRVGLLYERLFSERLRMTLYRLAILRFYSDDFLLAVIVGPVLALARFLDSALRSLVGSGCEPSHKDLS